MLTGRYQFKVGRSPTSSVGGPEKAKEQGDGSATGLKLATAAGGSLNPMWVEWLMGFPLGWTVLEPSETPSSRKSLKLSR